MEIKPKIAILVPRYGLVDRGIETFTSDFLKFLGDDFDIVVFSRSNALPNTKKTWSISESNKILQWIYGIHPWVARTLDRFFLNPMGIEMLSFSLFCLPHLLFSKYDILFPQNGIWGAVICSLVRFIKRTPFVYASGGGKEPPIVRQNPNLYIAFTPLLYKWIKEYRPSTNTVLIPYGINTRKFSPKVLGKTLSLKQPIFLCVSACIPQKRIDLAIRAVSLLKKGSLLVAGKGPLKESLINLGENLLGERRFLLKSFPHSMMPHIYKSCDVFTLASPDEPFGLVYLEAMASGLPVVATDDEGRRYIIGDAGILCDTQNIKEYSKALERAAVLDFDKRPIQQALKFNWEKVGKTYKKAFIDILKR